MKGVILIGSKAYPCSINVEVRSSEVGYPTVPYEEIEITTRTTSYQRNEIRDILTALGDGGNVIANTRPE